MLVLKDSNLRYLIQNSSINLHTKENVSRGFRSKMSSVNDILKTPEIKSFVWTYFKLPENLEMPEIDGELLNGGISSTVHSHGL